MIRKLSAGGYRLYARKIDPHTGRRAISVRSRHAQRRKSTRERCSTSSATEHRSGPAGKRSKKSSSPGSARRGHVACCSRGDGNLASSRFACPPAGGRVRHRHGRDGGPAAGAQSNASACPGNTGSRKSNAGVAATSAGRSGHSDSRSPPAACRGKRELPRHVLAAGARGWWNPWILITKKNHRSVFVTPSVSNYGS